MSHYTENPQTNEIYNAIASVTVSAMGHIPLSDCYVNNTPIIQGISLHNGLASIVLTANKSAPMDLSDVIANIEKNTMMVTGVERVYVAITNDDNIPLMGVQHNTKIIAIASAKGGVGKSTTAVNIALALSRMGLKTALLDLDIQGPSVARLLNCHSTKPVVEQYGIRPVAYTGSGAKDNNPLSVLSIGHMIDGDTPVIWRGAMMVKGVLKMLEHTLWGHQDVMILDLPPGTGEIPMTLASQKSGRQYCHGAVLVTTPQDLALSDVRKGITMFEKLNIPIIGMIENMGSYCCPHCDGISHPFGHNLSTIKNINMLGSIPLSPDLHDASEDHKPVLTNSPMGNLFDNIAKKIMADI